MDLRNSSRSGSSLDDDRSSFNLSTAIYNRASENQLSHAEAKLMYRRHILDASGGEQPEPLRRVRTIATVEDVELKGAASYISRGLVESGPRQDNSRGPAKFGPQTAERTIHGSQFFNDSGSDIDHSETAKHDQGREDANGIGRSPTIHQSDISPELQAISANVLRVLELRHHFLELSLQSPWDNPKDCEGWKIYPSPPNPTWNDNKSLSTSHPVSASERRVGSSPTLPKSRKPGLNIGDDFDLQDLEPLPTCDDQITYRLNEMSVYEACTKRTTAPRTLKSLVKVPSLRDYYKAMDEIQRVSSDGPTKSFAYRQLDILEGKFQLYHLVNSYQETADCKTVPHRDFYNVRKVDTHVHHSACMNQKHLLRFIKSKMKKCPDEVVMFRDGRELTLQQVFDSINLTAYDLSIDTLDMHAHTDSFHRFDKFNLKYNPVGESRLREIFLKTDNYIQGRYLAELTREVISDLEASKYQFVEWRISIYGRNIEEWDRLAAWVIDNKLISHNVRWLIQVPRLYSTYKMTGQVGTFEDVIKNIFDPLYGVTQDPSANPKLHAFLQRVVGFDSVDDESKIEVRLYRKFPPPNEWNTSQNPPYTYWIYHLYANMVSLNAWRKQRGFNTFVLRPHCGEAGDVDHLASAVLCCHSISHGLMLRKVPLLQYVFYLDQIGIAMSPLSNNALFLSYDRNPFPKYLRRGLNVSLSTDDPLQFAFTKEPLIEEYSVAAQIYRLSAVDMCELAQHSVIQSGFEHELKKRWLGDSYALPGVQGNSVAKTNVPNIREAFRYSTLIEEIHMLEQYAASGGMTGPAVFPATSLHLEKQHKSEPHANDRTQTPLRPSSSISQDEAQSSPSGKTSPERTRSLVVNSPSTQNLRMLPHSPIVPQARMFPGIVHDRHRRTSLRQGSGSETDGESMTGSWLSGDNRSSKGHVLGDAPLQSTVLEETIESS